LLRSVTKPASPDQPKNLLNLDQSDGQRTIDWLEAKELRLCVARVVRFHTLWKQAFAPALAAACQCCAAPSSFHAGAKTMLAFACSLGWLVSAFHKTENRLGSI